MQSPLPSLLYKDRQTKCGARGRTPINGKVQAETQCVLPWRDLGWLLSTYFIWYGGKIKPTLARRNTPSAAQLSSVRLILICTSFYCFYNIFVSVNYSYISPNNWFQSKANSLNTHSQQHFTIALHMTFDGHPYFHRRGLGRRK